MISWKQVLSLKSISQCSVSIYIQRKTSGPEVINIEHEIFLLINAKMPTIVGILALMSRKNFILGLYDPENAEFLDIF